ncbi:hypothetical protein Leryth_016984 [Lithospermum erythrorhizon]|nr:hypothetical protein Leryth_016984 [Lithospermum erythrorhizon]
MGKHVLSASKQVQFPPLTTFGYHIIKDSTSLNSFFIYRASVAYMASKFLGFLGLCLPCPCTVLGNYCVQRLLIDSPTEKVENVMISVRTKFPFNEFGVENGVDSKFGGYIRGVGNGGEGSCCSMSGARNGRIGGYIMEGGNGGEGSGGSMSDARKGRFGGYIMEGSNGGEGSCCSVSDARKGRSGGYIMEGSNGGEGSCCSVSDARKGRFGGYIMEGSNGGEGSRSSVLDARKGHIIRRLDWESDRRVDDSGFGEGGCDVKGKG